NSGGGGRKSAVGTDVRADAPPPPSITTRSYRDYGATSIPSPPALPWHVPCTISQSCERAVKMASTEGEPMPRRGDSFQSKAGFLGAVLLVSLLWLAAGHAGNASPDVIHACVNNITKVVRIVGVDGACFSRPQPFVETAIHWATTGSEGPPPSSSSSLQVF